ncbi:MAG: VanZ family protein, partial [Enterococcus sp.]|nr:VanZ family protein [Enterococcus sp.]
SFFVRKAAHMTEYAVLAVLFSIMAKLIWDAVELRSIRTPAKLFLFLYFLPFIATVLYAISDEVHQLFIAARAGQVTDVLIDAGGAVIGLLILLLVRGIREKIAK